MYPIFKRFLDVTVSLLLIILLMPLFIVLAFMIKLGSKGPVLFSQSRLGYKGKVFQLYKFRSMTNDRHDPSIQVQHNSAGVTLVGKAIRRFKIDELPQLLNILIGDMSFVGPRPCLETLMEQFNSDGYKRLLVRPGLTGLAQVNGNILLDWPQRWAFDREYVDKLSFILDVKIILRTILIVLFGEQYGIRKER